jgi:trans-2,3-dihydro-3-hydroxyanthranilate isomerase
MYRTLRYRVVDVFTDVPLEGNPLAVFYEGHDLESETMQRIARELNLSETAFILPATRRDCVACLRIFTPARELRFAGHPTIGSAYVARIAGVVAPDRMAFSFEEGVGEIPIRVEDDLIWLRTPRIERVGGCDRAACARVLDLREWDLLPDAPPQVYSAGNPTLFVAVADRETVDRARVDAPALSELEEQIGEAIGLFVFTPTSGGAYSRFFAPEYGVVEDPATGSATGPLAAYMMANSLWPGTDGTTFVSEQGVKMGRRSFLHVRIRGGNGSDGIDVGGKVTPLIDATMTLR